MPTDPLPPALVSPLQALIETWHLRCAEAAADNQFLVTPGYETQRCADELKAIMSAPALVSEAPRQDQLNLAIAHLRASFAAAGQSGLLFDVLRDAIVAVLNAHAVALSASRTPLSDLRGSLRGEESDAEFDAAVETIRASRTSTFQDTQLKAAIRKAFDNPTLGNIEAVAAIAATPTTPTAEEK